jgi:hypothetical protein
MLIHWPKGPSIRKGKEYPDVSGFRIQLPSRQRHTLHGTEYLAFQIGVFRTHLGKQLFDFIPFARPVLRAGILNYRETQISSQAADLFFTGIDQRAYLRYPGAVKKRDRPEAAEPSFEKQAHHESFHGIIEMMAECKLTDAHLRDRIIDGTSPHFGAERTGVVFIPDVEHNLLDICFQTGIGDAELFTELSDWGEVHSFKSKLNRNSFQLEMSWIIFPQMIKSNKQQHAILPAGYANSNSVALSDHTVVVYGSPHGTGKLIQGIVHGILQEK